MRFISKLYPYQEEILNVFEKERGKWERKIHIVAPPGSWKTIVGIEMILRLDVPALILVPNLTLQEQWKDKIEKMFLDSSEKSGEIISLTPTEIKKINILTYQSLSWSNTDEDVSVNEKIIDLWYTSEKKEFDSKDTFLLFIEGLKTENPNEYGKNYSQHRKKLKENGESEYTKKLMKESIHTYIGKLKEAWIQAIIVDEAHHLTSWWSKVIHTIYEDLGSPYIIGLTATPPFESVDYFELDESYVDLLGTVDYYIPTPAIVKSGRLAPYSDLLYIVSPAENLGKILKAKEDILKDFLTIHQDDIMRTLHIILCEDFSSLKNKSLDLLEKWSRFVYNYKDISIDMSPYITRNTTLPLTLEDIAKSIGKWASEKRKTSKKTEILDEVKKIFFDLGYIWRGSNLYKFETPIEKWLIYSKSKIDGVKTILKKEDENLHEELRCAIITDFLDIESDWINGHFLLDEINKDFWYLHPYLVSGQWIWKIENGEKILISNETILSVTEKFTKWEIKLIIGTRGILGEGWDCPPVNTLIDLTGVSAYMSVNQVHGRAIRLNPANLEKVANIYDIVCIGEGYQWLRDFQRIEKKHTQLYGVDDSGLIIKELDHIYPQLEKWIKNPEKINSYTLRKSSLRQMVKSLWNVGEESKNKEIFSLSIEVTHPMKDIYIPQNISKKEIRLLVAEKENTVNLLEFGKTTSHKIIRRWITEILSATLQTMKPIGFIPLDFNYKMYSTDSGSITIVGTHPDDLVNKRFLETISLLFETITDQKHIFVNKKDEQIDTLFLKKSLSTYSHIFLVFLFITLWSIIFTCLKLIPEISKDNWLIFGVLWWITMCIWIIYSGMIKKREWEEKILKKKFWDFLIKNLSIGLPEIISSNERKRRFFLGKEYDTIPERARWYITFEDFLWRNGKYLLIPSIILSVIFIIPLIEKGYSILLYFIMLNTIITLGWWLMLKTIAFLIHLPYWIYVNILNSIKSDSVIHLNWAIRITEQSDIGEKSILSAKIEKLWI